MGEVASSFVSIVPKISDNFGKQLETQMRKASTGAFGPIDQESKKQGEKSAKTFGSSFKSVAGPMLALAGVGAISAFVGKSVAAFSELEDATAAAGVVFGDSMGIVQKQADGAATSIFMSKQEAINAAITFGTFGKSAGLAGNDLAGFSTEMVQLAGDMASFRGTSTEESILAIGAAMRGEGEPIAKYGVLLNDANLKARALKLGLIATTKDALSPQNRVLAAQAEILVQTTDAQGDAARTADSTANVQKRLTKQTADLSAEIGGKLAPAIVEAQKAGIGMIQWATANQAVLLPLVTTFGSLALVIGTAVGAVKGLEKLKEARDAVKGLGDSFQSLGRGAKVATVSMGVVGVAIVAAGLIYGAFAQNQADAQAASERSTAAVEDYTAAIEADTGAMGENTRAHIVKRLEDSGALKIAQAMGIGMGDVTNAVLNGGAAMDKVTTVAVAYTDELGNQTDESKHFVEILGGENTALAGGAAATKRKTEATKGGTTATKTNSDALQANIDKLKAQSDVLEKRAGKRSLEAAIDAGTEAFKKNGKTLDENTPKGRANAQALDDIAKAGTAVGGNMTRARTKFIEVATAMTGSAKKARKLADDLKLIPKKVDTTVKVHFSQAEANFKIGLDYFGKKMAAGGAVSGGIRGRDSVPLLGMDGEHMLDTEDVRIMGGQQAVYRWRAALRSGRRMSNGGAVGSASTPTAGRSLVVQVNGADPREVTAMVQSVWRHDSDAEAVQS